MYSQIRQDIISGNLSTAFQQLDNFDSEYKNDIQLIWFQYNEWERKKNLNLGADSVEINRIIYGLLNTVSKIEKTSSHNGQVSEELQMYESKLEEGYQKLQQLELKTFIDIFLSWFNSSYPTIFRQVIEAEKSNVLIIEKVLTQIDLTLFIETYNVNVVPENLFNDICIRVKNDNNFFGDWMEYQEFKNKSKRQLQSSIFSIEKNYKKILEKAGYILIGVGIMWAITEMSESDIDLSDFDIDFSD